MKREAKGMRYRFLMTVLLGVGMAPFAAGAQQVAPPPLDVLLENREALALNPAQVARLDSIRSSLKAKNEPLINRVLELRAEVRREQRAANRAAGGRQGQALRQAPMQGQAQPRVARIEQIRGEIQSLIDQIAANNRAALTEQVNPMLNRQQKARLKELVEARRPAGPGSPGARGAGAQPRPPAPLGG